LGLGVGVDESGKERQTQQMCFGSMILSIRCSGMQRAHLQHHPHSARTKEQGQLPMQLDHNALDQICCRALELCVGWGVGECA